MMPCEAAFGNSMQITCSACNQGEKKRIEIDDLSPNIYIKVEKKEWHEHTIYKQSSIS